MSYVKIEAYFGTTNKLSSLIKYKLFTIIPQWNLGKARPGLWPYAHHQWMFQHAEKSLLLQVLHVDDAEVQNNLGIN